MEEFFQEFDQLVFIAEYTDTYHDNILVKLLHETIHIQTIDLIYGQPALPEGYQAWKTQVLAINGLQRCQAEQKKSQVHFTSNRPTIVRKPETTVLQIKMGTGITYGGQGQ